MTSLGFDRLETEIFREVTPVGIGGFDQLQFPISVPFLYALLAGDGGVHCWVLFEPDEDFNGVFRGESADESGPVLVDADEEAGGHARVERAVTLRREEIDAGLEVGVHAVRVTLFVIPANAGT
jgi:hypothetical protein